MGLQNHLKNFYLKSTLTLPCFSFQLLLSGLHFSAKREWDNAAVQTPTTPVGTQPTKTFYWNNMVMNSLSECSLVWSITKRLEDIDFVQLLFLIKPVISSWNEISCFCYDLLSLRIYWLIKSYKNHLFYLFSFDHPSFSGGCLDPPLLTRNVKIKIVKIKSYWMQAGSTSSSVLEQNYYTSNAKVLKNHNHMSKENKHGSPHPSFKMQCLQLLPSFLGKQMLQEINLQHIYSLFLLKSSSKPNQRSTTL